MELEFLKFKHKKDRSLVLHLHPIAIMILMDMSFFCFEHGEELILTETVTTLAEDKKQKRKSTSHRERRAADLRSRNYSKEFIKKLVTYANKKYRKYAAISASDLKPRLIVIEKNHLHLQINKMYALPVLEDIKK